MANQEDIDRAQKGKDVWNAWAEKNPGTGVNFHKADFKQIDFAGFVFPGAAGFVGATLDAHASFKDAIFLETANFTSARFLGSGDFHGATFKGEVTFHSVRFHKGSDFDGATFEGHANFLSANFEGGEVDFRRTAFLQDAIFAEANFAGGVVFSGVSFGKVAEFRAARFSGHAIFRDATFQGFAGFGSARFRGVAEFRGARFQGSATFRGATFQGHVSFEGRTFEMQADFVDTTFDGRAVFENATFDRTAVFNNANFNRHANFISCSFATVPAFHGATLHEDTTFEGATWPEPPYEGQSAYDAARAWGRLRVEMSRLHRHEDELFFFERELGERARDTNNEPLAKRLLYRIYLVLGAGRSVAKPLGWLLGLNAVLFLPIYWVAVSAIHWRTLPIRDVLAEVLSFNIPADVVSFTLGQALPFIGGSNPERADLYRRLFPHGESNGIDVPLWLEIAGIFQQLSGLVLLFMIGLALRNRFRMK